VNFIKLVPQCNYVPDCQRVLGESVMIRQEPTRSGAVALLTGFSARKGVAQ
jgi:hypothetical protein